MKSLELKKCYKCKSTNLKYKKNLVILGNKFSEINVLECQKCGETYSTMDETERIRKQLNPSINIDDIFLINLSKHNKIAGLELLNVNSLLDVSKDILNNIKTARIMVTSLAEQKKLFINTELISLNKEQSITIPPIPSNLHSNCTISAF